MERTLAFISPPSRCEYLPDRTSRLQYELVPDLVPADYVRRLQSGWRRFGYAMFRPHCPSCSMCQSLRVPVDTFVPTRSHRRVWRRNHDLALRIGDPAITRDRIVLWQKFHAHGERAKGWPSEYAPAPGLMLQNPFPIEEWAYYRDDALVGVGYVDVLPGALSAIYFYWDPDESARSPGTFNILRLLDAARTRGLGHVYLGYYVRGCRSLEYKARFAPHEILDAAGAWMSPAATPSVGP